VLNALSMSEHDPNETLRGFREYFARSNESQKKIAARLGVTRLVQRKNFSARNPSPNKHVNAKGRVLTLDIEVQSKCIKSNTSGASPRRDSDRPLTAASSPQGYSASFLEGRYLRFQIGDEREGLLSAIRLRFGF
jgi:hypothetical protein